MLDHLLQSLHISFYLPPKSLPGEDEHSVGHNQKGHDDDEHVPKPKHDVQLLVDYVKRKYAGGAAHLMLASRRMLPKLAHGHLWKYQVQRRGEVLSVPAVHSAVEVIAAERENLSFR